VTQAPELTATTGGTAMAFTINEADVAREPVGDVAGGHERQRLITRARVPDTRVLLDRWTIGGNGAARLAINAGSLAWVQVLEGDVVLQGGGRNDALDASHIVFLPPGFSGTLSAAAGAVLLVAEVPDAARHDPAFTASPPGFRIVDWTREPVLDSEHDARKRIYVVTPALFNTRALKGEMIIYPPSTAGAEHHHEGAEHFMYVLAGSGTAFAGGKPIRVRRGDLIYYDDFERHYLRSDVDVEVRFIEFFVPGVYRTVWAENAPVCTWLPTGRDIRGNTPVREIRKHSHAEAATANDI
jgi:quercetin dioxygenase-like cupin family protein